MGLGNGNSALGILPLRFQGFVGFVVIPEGLSRGLRPGNGSSGNLAGTGIPNRSSGLAPGRIPGKSCIPEDSGIVESPWARQGLGVMGGCGIVSMCRDPCAGIPSLGRDPIPSALGSLFSTPSLLPAPFSHPGSIPRPEPLPVLSLWDFWDFPGAPDPSPHPKIPKSQQTSPKSPSPRGPPLGPARLPQLLASFPIYSQPPLLPEKPGFGAEPRLFHPQILPRNTPGASTGSLGSGRGRFHPGAAPKMSPLI